LLSFFRVVYISCGFWAGDARYPRPAFYAYVAPAPAGIELASIRPDTASFNKDMGEFILNYDDMRAVESPGQALLDFFESTYDVSAQLARWDREALERQD